ncbi:MAG: glycosyltransferase family 39 protein [Verrucomicrobiae bacterium]|nr:glycosyltransferase family 39 protein [Verrucomicrobiae bacterium]
MEFSERTRSALTLTAFVLVYLALVVGAYRGKSATWDEPQHLTAGIEIRLRGDYRFDPEHPPWLRLWAALPVRPPTIITNCPVPQTGDAWLFFNQFLYAHHFLYELNDADRLLNRARFQNALWGVVLGFLLFAFVRERFGYWPATIILGVYTLEPNLLAHAGLVTTDFGLTVLVFGTVFFLWRTCCQPVWLNWAGLIGFFAMAQVSKFTAILLWPIVVVALALAVWRGRCRWTLAVVGLVVLVGVTWAAIWAVYGWRYLASAISQDTLGVTEIPMVRERVPALCRAVEWAGEHRLLPNAYLEGFLLGQAKAQARSAYLAGRYSVEGWWYFFPVAMLLKTPLALLALWVAGVVQSVRRWRNWEDAEWLLLGTAAVFLGVAMMSRLNIGLRHVLPVYPLLMALVAGTIADWFRQSRQVRAWGIMGLMAVELAIVYPHCLAFFNVAVGGPWRGGDYLVDSNLDWGQDLKGLKRWMEKQGLEHINLSYFGTADPAYYGIRCTHLPGAPLFATAQAPRLPGYVAVSETNLRGVYFSEELRAFYRPLLMREPVAVIGHSIRVYWVEKPWW